MKCSIVVPVYNSSAWIATTIGEIISEMNAQNKDFELILVDDHSTDNTLSILNEKSALDSRIKVISNSVNTGQHRTTLAGIEQATGDYIVTIDDDMEYNPADIPRLYHHITKSNFDLAYGVPLKNQRSGLKQFLYWWYLRDLKAKNRDRKTSFRIMNSKTARQLSAYKDASPFVLDFFLEKITGNMGYLDVQHYSKATSRYSIPMYFRHLLDIRKLNALKGP